MEVLKVGSSGDAVKKIQEKIGVNADGVFGKGTEKAIMEWQSKNGLTPDGVVGQGTWDKMFSTPSTPVQSGGSDFYKVLKGQIPDEVYNQITTVMDKFQINTPLRMAHFLAQCSHESGNFKAVSENLNYSSDGLKKIFGRYFPGDLATQYAKNPEKIASRVYGSRMGNGDESTKEGYKFRGRGYIQLTGKSNYQAFSTSIGEDVVSNPDLVSSKYSLSSAAWFFNRNNLNSISDKGISELAIKELTKRINGGYNGLEHRVSETKRFANLLGVK